MPHHRIKLATQHQTSTNNIPFNNKLRQQSYGYKEGGGVTIPDTKWSAGTEVAQGKIRGLHLQV
jgi:hypothetical protein